MTFASLIAVLWLTLPKTEVSAELKGWEASGAWNAPYASSRQHLVSDLSVQGYRFVRCESVGAGRKTKDIFKFADGRGGVVIVMLWQIGPTMTGYSYRRENAQGGREGK